jgi:phage terminase large subunit-like protein
MDKRTLQKIDLLLSTGNEQDLFLAQQLANSPYLQFEPREDDPDNGDEMSSFFYDDWNGAKCIIAGNACHAKGTLVLMYDGTIKKVEDISLGDTVMGNDGTPRTVLQLHSGIDKLFKITPKGNKGNKVSPYNDEVIVNGNHTLHLKRTSDIVDHKSRCKNARFNNHFSHNGDGSFDISVNDFINQSDKFKNSMVQTYCEGVEFCKKDLKIDPYFLGVWLGDGSKHRIAITTVDEEIIDYCKSIAIQYDLNFNKDEITYHLTKGNVGHKGENVNHLLREFKKCNLINNKHIPFDYLTSSKEDRYKLLAGLIDTDGTLDSKSFNFTNKNKQLSLDVVYLCRSLGLKATIQPINKYCFYKGIKKEGLYYSIYISGEIHKVPTKTKRKQAPIHKPHNRFRFNIEEFGEGEYYGFTLDGNHLFCLGNFWEQSNSGKTYCSAMLLCRELEAREPPLPNTPVWIISQTLEMCGSIYSQAISQFIPADRIENIRWRKMGLYPETVILKKNKKGNNYIIQFFSYEMGRQALQSSNVYMAWLDEQAPQAVIEEVMTRLRTWWHPNCFIYSLTPLSPDPHLQELYERREDDDVKNLWRFYRLNTMKNEFVDKTWKSAFLESLSPEQRQTRQFGQFSNYSGAIYKEFGDHHVINPFDITGASKWLLGVDFGFRFNAASWIAELNGKYYVFDELLMQETMTEDFCEAILKKGFDYRYRAYCDWADPMAIRRMDIGGIYAQNALKNVYDGIETLRSLFYQDRLFIFKTCKRTIMQMRNYCWEEIKEGKEVKQQPKKVNDHLCLPAGELIDTPNGRVPIEYVKSGDYVYSHLGIAKVEAAAVTGIKQVFKVVFDDGRYILCTGEHPLRVCDGGWVEAENSKDCMIEELNGNGIRVRDIVPLEEEVVYALKTSDGTFFCNGILLKNCDSLRYCVYSSIKQELKGWSQPDSGSIKLTGATEMPKHLRAALPKVVPGMRGIYK